MTVADLVVELYGTRIGTLTGTWRTFDFIADPTAVTEFGVDSLILSVAVPLAPIPTRAGKQRRQNYFAELLPEGRMLTRMAAEAGVPIHDSIGLLRRFGRDVAGALQIWDPEVPGEPKAPRLDPLTTAEIANLLAHVQDNPLGNRPVGGKTSLAGVQDKIVLARTPSGRWNQVIDGYPSTHILKPETSSFPTMIYDEEYGSRFARAVGLASFATWIDDFHAVPALIIERYDRSPDAPAGRIHQEDLSQALGAGGSEKYQKHGGRVSLARIANLLTQVADRDSVARLLRLTVLSIAVGNLDLHTKNLSLVHHQNGSMSLAPAYDVVPQTHLNNDGELALAVDHEYRHAAITRNHLTNEGRSWGLSHAERIVDETLRTVLDMAAVEKPDPRAHPGLAQQIARFAKNLLGGGSAGDR